MPDSKTPTRTPIARLCVETTPATVASMTTLELRGCVLRFLIDVQLKVPIETMIMTATSAAIGISFTQSPSTTIRNSRNDPGEEGREPPAAAGFHVDDRLADHGAAGHAADEAGGQCWRCPGRCIRGSCRWACRSGRRRSAAVISDFEQADRGDGDRVGQDDHAASRGSAECPASGTPAASTGNSPMSPTVRTSSPSASATAVSTTMQTSGDGTALVRRGKPGR